MSFTPPPSEWHAVMPPFPTSAPKPVLSPTSAPQPSKAVPERKAKLRASCDACAASKVKCSKEHPICQRCASNGSQCIYGISRKHGKPGRTRKRNPDGTPFVKASKQRPSPDGSEFGKFRVKAGSPILPELPDLPSETASSVASWPSTPEWPATPEFEYSDFNMTPLLDPLYTDADFAMMDELLLSSTQSPMIDSIPNFESEPTFTDPFAKRDTQEVDFSMQNDFQPLKNFVGGDSVNPMDYTFNASPPFIPPQQAMPEITPPQSPKGSNNSQTSKATNPAFSTLRTSVAMPASHCCYSTAYSTLETLTIRTSDNGATIEKTLDSVLSITKVAVQQVMQLLSCPCSSDPHLAMLYSSIASKILTWYQIAAGLKPATTGPPSLPSTSPTCSSSSDVSDAFLSPISPASMNSSAFAIAPLPLKCGLFEFDAADQEALRRQVVLRELKKCSALVEALANWRSNSEAEQAEFLYDVLGAWLKSELYKTIREVSGEEE
ncbi:hypothetical protein BU24DRAFT_420859 [Aaosphaeria arxii CBS 175.79]|uniref:Zn(2)-C6 fungal-type domain-containing protein n=1 Tax=Aaosphaeria arxii CBS 175.79 TaxID=1450172 RepID=A0A6A5XY03_9PLEO|nr:uncharacterized protein BU24DRAFT_420859 [Aaosphaeria arxii CBS 175.79]KAF2017803.1 hypothetical protein BU24DRAFT_420859 [Aaosphaeria arxii CBS 175.79]